MQPLRLGDSSWTDGTVVAVDENQTMDTCTGHGGVAGVCVGADVVEIARFETWLADEAEVLTRLFTDAERSYATRRPRTAATLAGIWAAKEAWAKAHGRSMRAGDPRRVEITHEPCGAPRLVVDGRTVTGSVSISHDGPVAFAVALIAVNSDDGTR